MAPTFVPELKMPVASARSFFGNHSATVLIDAGKFPASPNPSRNRIRANPAAAPVSSTTDRPVFGSRLTVGSFIQSMRSATACPTAATLQMPTAMAKPRRVPSLSMMLPARRSPIA